jgi:hypothetical protein
MVGMRESENHGAKSVGGFGARPGSLRMMALAVCASLLLLSAFAFAQQPEKQQPARPATASSTARDYPKEIRGYKVERAKVEIKGPRGSKKEGEAVAPAAASDAEALIEFGEPHVSRVTPLGITLEIPVTVAALKQGGHVDFLTFEDMVVNGTPVTIDDYNHPFELPTSKPALLPEPITIYISMPRALLGAVGEWNQPKAVWPVTGRVYVFGRFKKFLFTFKRVVPVELNVSFANPMKSKTEGSRPLG